MPLGDSITSGSSYRQPLADLLKTAQIARTDFVGSIRGHTVQDGNHEGHPCYKITAVLRPPGTGAFQKCIPQENAGGDARDLEIWFNASTPDIVLWHTGTNDVWAGEQVEQIMLAFSATLTKLRQRNPRVTILVAQILPMTMANVGPLNAGISQWAARNATEASRIIVVDMNSGFDASWTHDGVHPNSIGSKWMADRWFRTLKPILERQRIEPTGVR